MAVLMLMLMLVMNRCYQHHCYGRSLAVHWLFTGCSLGSRGQAGCKTERLIRAENQRRRYGCAHAHAHACYEPLLSTPLLWPFTGCSLAVHWLFTWLKRASRMQN